MIGIVSYFSAKIFFWLSSLKVLTLSAKNPTCGHCDVVCFLWTQSQQNLHRWRNSTQFRGMKEINLSNWIDVQLYLSDFESHSSLIISKRYNKPLCRKYRVTVFTYLTRVATDFIKSSQKNYFKNVNDYFDIMKT